MEVGREMEEEEEVEGGQLTEIRLVPPEADQCKIFVSAFHSIDILYFCSPLSSPPISPSSATDLSGYHSLPDTLPRP